MGEDEWVCCLALSGGVDQDASFHTGEKLTVQRVEKFFFGAAELMNSGPSRSVVVYGGLSCVNKQSTQSVSSQLNTYNCYWIQAKELGISQVASFIVLLS